MRNKLLLVCLALSMAVMAGERSASEAAAVAAQFMNQQVLAPARKASVNASSYKLAHTRQKLNSTEPAFYVFNNASEGYVVVSADDRTEDVLMYSEEGTLDVEKANPNLKFWLNRLQEEISVANDENTFTAAEKKARKATMVTAISPLLVNDKGEEITWYQEAPYWNQCPLQGTDTCLTGCVATAAAQIMYKWRYPEKGTGSHSYTTSSKKIAVSQDFSQVTFDWDNMLPNYMWKVTSKVQNDAVATLMRCCGVACDMDYTSDGSGAYTDVMGVGLTTYFGYKAEKFIQMKNYEYSFEPTESNLTADKFAKYFNADLEAGRPILMGGTDTNGNGGHEFVCDGRDASGNFHINWGWEGQGNCYCALTALKPTDGSGYNFSSSLDAMIGLEPAVVDTVHVTGVTVAPTTLTLKINEKSTLSATVAPTNATDKSVTWSSNNKAIATVDTNGKVVGVSQGNATITATTTDGGFKATCAVTVSADTIEVTECGKYSYTFTSKCTTGSNTLGSYTWNIVLNAGTVQNVDATKGQQFGSSDSPCGQVSLSTSNTAECIVNTVKVNASMASKGDAQLAIYIGGTQIGSTQTLTTTATDYTFSNTAGEQGNLEIRLTNTAKAMYIKTIEVNPDGGEDPIAVIGVTLNKSTLSIQEGAQATLTATIQPENADNKNVTWSSSKESVATVSAAGVVTAVAEGTAVITVKTEDGNYTATCDVTVTEPVQGNPFELVTKVANLKAGLEVLIVNIDAKKAISTTQKENNRAAADVTITNNKITLSEPQTEVEVFTLATGSETNTWAFSPSDGGYIYAASSSSNYLRTQTNLDANASFSISIDSDETDIVAQGTNTRNEIRYNPGNKSQDPIFSCYASTSTMSKVSIFARESTSTAITSVSGKASMTSQKVLLDGQLYILHEGCLYNAQGILVK